tara:strand:+ start:210 stop:386 length:177 start_codon:yes stop_codon:yes gene_type:complete
MWFLIFLMFSGPMDIEDISILEVYLEKEKCLEKIKESLSSLPKNSQIGCIYFGGISKT